MKDLQTQREDRAKKAHRIGYSSEQMQQDSNSELGMMEMTNLVKRQKMDNNLRVATARQA
ncbi:hypothetical protein A2U01_0109197, partial [Trifolium medium]|nr:hypothetical protein [Trifolium medium]